jgi:hypothetical protein
MSTELSEMEELHTISEATNEDGTIDVELHDFTKTEDGMVGVEFVTPTGDIEREVLEWPESDDPKEYKFVRIFDEAGYGIIAVEEACNQSVTVPAKRDPWRLHAPAPKSRTTRFKERLLSIRGRVQQYGNAKVNDDPEITILDSFPLSLIIIPVALFSAMSRVDRRDFINGYGTAVIHILLWAAIAAAIPMLL